MGNSTPDSPPLEFSFIVKVRLQEEVPGAQTREILAESLQGHLRESNPQELVWLEDDGGYWTVESWDVRTGTGEPQYEPASARC